MQAQNTLLHEQILALQLDSAMDNMGKENEKKMIWFKEGDEENDMMKREKVKKKKVIIKNVCNPKCRP